MNVRTLCLSVLYEEDATGYDIRRMCVDGELSYFVEASFGSIYPALNKLEAEGLVVSKTVPQDGKPARKVYSITEAGREAFVQELHEPLGEDLFRSPFLLFARYAHVLPTDLVRTRVSEHLSHIQQKREKLDAIEAEPGCSPADCWVINYGRSVMAVAEQYLRTHMDRLITLSRAEPSKDAAE
jgi:PadR family transcriptional regulator, regulatory protein AphA